MIQTQRIRNMSAHIAIATTVKARIGITQAPTEEPGDDEVKVSVEYAAIFT
jgi:hypothetical protein